MAIISWKQQQKDTNENETKPPSPTNRVESILAFGFHNVNAFL